MSFGKAGVADAQERGTEASKLGQGRKQTTGGGRCGMGRWCEGGTEDEDYVHAIRCIGPSALERGNPRGQVAGTPRFEHTQMSPVHAHACYSGSCHRPRTDTQTGIQTDKQTGTQEYRHTDITDGHTDRHTDTQAYRQTLQTGAETGTQTNRHTRIQTDIPDGHTGTHTCIQADITDEHTDITDRHTDRDEKACRNADEKGAMPRVCWRRQSKTVKDSQRKGAPQTNDAARAARTRNQSSCVVSFLHRVCQI